MAATKGSRLLIKRNGDVICSGITSKKIKFGGDPIDITSDDDGGWRLLMSEVGVKSIDISFEGVAKDTVLRALRLQDANMFHGIIIVFANGDSLVGDFFMSSYDEAFKTNEAVTFSCELQSSGHIQYQPYIYGGGV